MINTNPFGINFMFHQRQFEEKSHLRSALRNRFFVSGIYNNKHTPPRAKWENCRRSQIGEQFCINIFYNFNFINITIDFMPWWPCLRRCRSSCRSGPRCRGTCPCSRWPRTRWARTPSCRSPGAQFNRHNFDLSFGL